MSAKERYTLYFTYMIIGALLLALGHFQVIPARLVSYVEGFGAVFLVLGLAKSLRYHRIASDEDTAREYDAKQAEERTGYITLRASRWVFLGTIWLQLAASVAFSFLSQSLAAQILAYLSALQGVAYSIIWRVLDRKY